MIAGGGESIRIELTNESLDILRSVYSIYKKRREDGISRDSAVRFSESDVSELPGFNGVKSELCRAKLITCFITGNFDLSDSAIALMEKLVSEEEIAKQSNEGKQIDKGNPNKFKKIVGFFVALVGFIGSIITIAQFWPEIDSFFSGLLP